MDWRNWHDDYDRPGSRLARRLQVVQQQIRAILDDSPPGTLRVLSVCAGQGRDLIEVLADHPRRGDVRARLVELDPRNTAIAQEAARAAGLDGVEVVTADASLTDHYRGMSPADLVLICGVFGNIADEDVEQTIDACSRLCGTGGAVIWTRHRRAPDLVPTICDWFEKRGFERQWLTEPQTRFGVGVHRFRGEPKPLADGLRMFTFVGFDELRQGAATG
jgi:ACT domain-containing protein